MTSGSRADDGRTGPALPVGDEGAERLFAHPLVVVALLAAAAGFIDAFAFLRLGVFVANMSGNVVILGLGLGGASTAGWLAGSALAGFALGAMLGVWLRAVGRRRDLRTGTTLPLAVQSAVTLAVIVWVLVAPSAVVPGTAAALGAVLVLSAANGMQAFVITQVHGVPTPTTYATGAIVSSSAGVVGSLLDRTGVEGEVFRRRLGIAITTPAGYLAGALAFALLRDTRYALLIPLAVMLVLLAVAARTSARHPTG